jgi:hypothetical protein
MQLPTRDFPVRDCQERREKRRGQTNDQRASNRGNGLPRSPHRDANASHREILASIVDASTERAHMNCAAVRHANDSDFTL